MKKIIISYLIVLIGISCSQLNSDIETVKKSKFSNEASTTIEEELTSAAGISGKAEWISFIPEGMGKNISCVEVNITRTMKNKTVKKIRLQYLLNRDTKFVKLHAAEVDKKPVSPFNLMLQLGMMEIENL